MSSLTVQPMTDEELSTTLIAISRAFKSFEMESVRVVISDDGDAWDLEFLHNDRWSQQAAIIPCEDHFEVIMFTPDYGDRHSPPDVNETKIGDARTLYQAGMLVLKAFVDNRFDNLAENYDCEMQILEEKRLQEELEHA